MKKQWLAIGLLMASLAHASTLEEAKLKLAQKEFAAARAIYEELAATGNAKACYNLGLMYHDGDGVTQNIKEAFTWYQKSAELNYKEAQYMVAALVFKRETQQIGYAEAVQYYQRAAEQGHVKSQLNLGMLYYRGDVIPQDAEASVKWLALAASNNNSEAQGYLANMYAQGIGVPQDIAKAAMWLTIAKQNEDQRYIARHTKMLNYTIAQMNTEQITAAKHLVTQCQSQQLKAC